MEEIEANFLFLTEILEALNSVDDFFIEVDMDLLEEKLIV